jgi:hypothetical protein
MHRKLSALLAAALVAVSMSVPARDDSAVEIEGLLDFVAASGCDFERNGEIHSAEDAADHLRLKYRRGRRYADSAENFIDRLATGSSWSGKPYSVYCEGEAQPSGDWLHEALRAQRAAATAGGAAR